MRKSSESEGDIQIDGIWYQVETAQDLRKIRQLEKYLGVLLPRPLYDIEARIKNEGDTRDGAKRGY